MDVMKKLSKFMKGKKVTEADYIRMALILKCIIERDRNKPLSSVEEQIKALGF